MSKQDLSLGRGCVQTGVIQHEFIHALGKKTDDLKKIALQIMDSVPSAMFLSGILLLF